MVAGLVTMLADHTDQIEIAEAIVIGEPIDTKVDVALYDSFGREGLEAVQLEKLLGYDEINRVAVYSFNLDGGAVQEALDAGAAGYLSKTSPAEVLVEQIVRLAAGQQVVGPADGPDRTGRDRAWPGRDLGLSEREAEVVALAAIGRRNADIAEALFVSIDTVKTHLARSFRKLGVSNRTEMAALILRTPSFQRRLSRSPV